MKHDCQATNEGLVDLLFGELDGGPRGALLEEVVCCEACASQYRTMAETLRVFDEAAAAALPTEDFWPGYEERLRRRMSQEIQQNFWQQAAFPFARARAEYRLTFVEDEGLTRRLAREVRAVARDAELTWPEFRRDPFGFTRRSVEAYGQACRTFFTQRNVALASLASVVFVSLLLGSVFALESIRAKRQLSANPYENLQLVGYVDENGIPREQDEPDKGPAGTNDGNGGGSKQKYERPGGGGGGGREEQLEASRGKLPTAQLEVPPIMTANPNPSTVTNPHLAMPVTVQVDPMLIKPDPRDIPYGLPDSASTTPSSGSGKGGGMGEGTGGGVGTGEGTGAGPGRGYNIGGGDAHEGGSGAGGGRRARALPAARYFPQQAEPGAGCGT